jgi:hypothetical protein
VSLNNDACVCSTDSAKFHSQKKTPQSLRDAGFAYLLADYALPAKSPFKKEQEWQQKQSGN